MRIKGSRIHCEVEDLAGHRKDSSGKAGDRSDTVRTSLRLVTADVLGPLAFLLGLCIEDISVPAV